LKKAHIFGYLVIFLLISLWSYSCSHNSSEKVSGEKTGSEKKMMAQKKRGAGQWKKGNRNMAATPVEVTRVVRGDIANYLLFSSAVETENTTDLYPKVSGEIMEIYYDEGQFVKKNQVIMKIDDRQYRIQAERARVNYEQLKSELSRLSRLKEKDLVSEEEYDKAKFSVEQAKLDWDLSKLNLEYTNIRAPFDGVVAERFVNIGDRVATTTKLLTFTNLREKIVKIYVPQNDIINVFRGQKAVITTDIMPGLEFEGWVKRISPVIDPTSGTFKVTVGIRDPKNQMNPGIFVNVSLIVKYHTNTLLIPKSALIYESEKAFYYLIKNGKALKTELKKGFEDAYKVEVLNSIAEGDTVVVVGQNALKNDVPVKIIKERHYAWQGNAIQAKVSQKRVESYGKK
jgi:membrane fusion protein (multidrug efflux system)